MCDELIGDFSFIIFLKDDDITSRPFLFRCRDVSYTSDTLATNIIRQTQNIASLYLQNWRRIRSIIEPIYNAKKGGLLIRPYTGIYRTRRVPQGFISYLRVPTQVKQKSRIAELHRIFYVI